MVDCPPPRSTAPSLPIKVPVPLGPRSYVLIIRARSNKAGPNRKGGIDRKVLQHWWGGLLKGIACRWGGSKEVVCIQDKMYCRTNNDTHPFNFNLFSAKLGVSESSWRLLGEGMWGSWRLTVKCRACLRLDYRHKRVRVHEVDAVLV